MSVKRLLMPSAVTQIQKENSNMKLFSTSEYQAMSPEDVVQSLESGESGLSSETAQSRISQFGYNEVQEARRNSLRDFLKRYWGPMPWLLEVSIVLTLILHHYTESAIIFILLTINAVIGQVQAGNSHKAVEMLKKKLEIKVKVLRNGEWSLLNAREIVPGDVISLKLGDLIPADAYLLSGDLSVDQSALTGESLPVKAGQSDIVYSSSVVKRGEAKCLVLSTGVNTYFGKTAELVKVARPKSKQEELMLTIVRYMMYLGIAASIIVSIYGIYLHKDILFILSFIVIFLIGAIPVALPAVLTIVQAVGAMDLSKKGILVTKLDCIEDAASIDIFCFDKTGTITQNRLSVVGCSPFGSFQEKDLIRLAALASKEEGMDLIDAAVLAYAEKSGLKPDYKKRIRFTPFSPEIRRTEAVIKEAGAERTVMKGAVPTLLALCGDMDDSMKKAVVQADNAFSEKGFRSLAVAVTKGSQTRIAGLLAIADPPREDSAHMISQIRSLGIKPMMITGDSAPIAREVAGQVGIGDRILRACELHGQSRENQLRLIRESDGFAEVFPEDKYEIVKLLQESGHTVGMTGDGVNDSPALKQAELGTAVCEAADVAKASASMILTQPGLGEIIDAVIVSRKTYQRMLTWVINKITKVVEVVFLFTIGFFWLQNMLVSLLGMSLLVFANDFITMSIATDRVQSTASPNQWNLRSITASSLCLGVLFALEDLLITWIGIHQFHLPLAQLQTAILLALVFNTQFRVLTIRERKHFWSSKPSIYLLTINIVTIIAFALLGIWGLIIPAISATAVFGILGIVMACVLVIDLIKYYLFLWFHV